MTFDQHKDLAYATVITAPSPASSGLFLDVPAGTATIFPTPPYNATVWPAHDIATFQNAEVIRVTAHSPGGGVGGSDRFTITRAQGTSQARSILATDQIAATITTKLLSDLESISLLGVSVASANRTYAQLSGANTNWSTPDSASIAPTTVMDVRMKVLLPTYTPAALTTLAAQWNTTGNQRGWQWLLKTDGTLQWQYSLDGTSTTFTLSSLVKITDPAGIPTQFLNGKIYLRGVAKSNDPANPSHATWQSYYSIDDEASWIPLGGPSNNPNFAANWFNSTASLFVGQTSNGVNFLTGRVYRFKLYDGTPTLEADFLPSTLANPPVAISNGGTGETWTPQSTPARGLDEVSNDDLRDWSLLPKKIQPAVAKNSRLSTDQNGNVVWVGTGIVEISGWDETGATDSAPLIRAAYDSGARYIRLVASAGGLFLINTPIFFDVDESTTPGRQVVVEGNRVTLVLGSGLPNVTEFDAAVTVNPGTKFAFFPSTLRTALIGSTVTAATNYASPSRAPTHPHFLLRDISVDGLGANVGCSFGNRGGATKFDNVHLFNLRAGMSWTDYVDGNSCYSTTLAANNSVTAPADAYIMYVTQNGDGIVMDNCKVSQAYKLCNVRKNLGGTFRSNIGGGMVFTNVNGVMIQSDHQEQMTALEAAAYRFTDTLAVLSGGECQNADGAGSGMFYVDDSNVSGSHSQLEIVKWGARRRVVTTDNVMSADIYLNNFSQESTLTVRGGGPHWSVQGSSVLNRYPRGYVIDGNATNLPTLAAAVRASRDVIGSGDFVIRWRNGAIDIAAIGPMGGFKVTRTLGQPSISNLQTGAQGANGTLINATLYEYAIALGYTMPDGSIIYGQASAAVSGTTTTNLALSFQVNTHTAPGGCTLIVWRKTGAGVLATPDRYILLPWGFNQSRLLDTGANLNSLPWLTVSGGDPVPNVVAAIDHTGPGIYVDGVAA